MIDVGRLANGVLIEPQKRRNRRTAALESKRRNRLYEFPVFRQSLGQNFRSQNCALAASSVKPDFVHPCSFPSADPRIRPADSCSFTLFLFPGEANNFFMQ